MRRRARGVARRRASSRILASRTLLAGVRFQRLNGILELREVLEHLNQVLEHQVLEQHFRR